jgi:hypothetical protein
MITSILKRTVLFCSFIAVGFMAKAQFTYGPKISGGITNATTSVPPAITDGSSTSIKTHSNSNLNGTIGLAVGYQFSDFWAINSGVFYQYIQPTFRQSTSPSTTITDKMNYINIPLEIVHTNDQLKKGWYYGVGVNFGLGISGSEESVTDGISQAVNKTIKFDGEINPGDPNNTHYNFLNIGGTGKVGYFFGKMFIGADANFGFSNIAPDYNSKYKINTYNLHIGYTFNRKVVKPEAIPTDTTTP